MFFHTLLRVSHLFNGPALCTHSISLYGQFDLSPQFPSAPLRNTLSHYEQTQTHGLHLYGIQLLTLGHPLYSLGFW